MISELLFKNSYGGYNPQAKEYEIFLSDRNLTPLPWVNIISNPTFGTMVTEAGSSFTWFHNSYFSRLTPWVNDPVTESGGELLYLRDEDSGEIWSPTPLPLRETEDYRIRHGHGYTIFEHLSHQLSQKLSLFVSPDQPIKFVQLKLVNTSARRKRVSATFFCQWVLADFPEKSRSHLWVGFDPIYKTPLAKNLSAWPFSDYTAYLATSAKKPRFCISRTEFFGRNNPARIPDALQTPCLSNSPVSSSDPCGAIQGFVDLSPGEEKTITFFLGVAQDKNLTKTISHLIIQKNQTMLSFNNVKESWKEILSAVSINTPNKALNILMNDQLLYQTLSCRLWGRANFYQPGGAFGFRDQLQDSLATLWSKPSAAKEHILLSASRQFDTGEVQHWWHPPKGEGIRSLSSDAHLWLVYVVIQYIKITGDIKLLYEVVPYLHSDYPKQQNNVSFVPEVSKQKATIYDHCVAAIERTLSLRGSHGLPLMLAGDWNDSLDNVGVKRKGESIWLSIFLASVLNEFIPLCILKKDKERASLYRRLSKKQIGLVEKLGWDGEWFLRALTDDGSPLGSKKNRQAQIDSIPQSWSVISQLVNPQKAKVAMKSVLKHLVNETENLVLLLNPPFHEPDIDPGYIKDYPPGTRENGSFYVHAGLWVAWAFALLGDGNRAMQILDMVNPLLRSNSDSKAKKYCVEPYVLASDIYSQTPYVGRGGWTWYTVSSAIFYFITIESILGLEFRGHELRFDPCIPREWKSFSVKFRHDSANYLLTVDNPEGVNKGVKRVVLDGQLTEGDKILLVNDHQNHKVVVTLGPKI